MYVLIFELKTSLHVLGEHNSMKTEFYLTNTKSGPCSSTFCIDNYYCCACSKTSISTNKYVQKVREPENDAGFLKHNSQLNCSYSYPSKPRLVVTVFRLHIYGLSKWIPL